MDDDQLGALTLEVDRVAAKIEEEVDNVAGMFDLDEDKVVDLFINELKARYSQ